MNIIIADDEPLALEMTCPGGMPESKYLPV